MAAVYEAIDPGCKDVRLAIKIPYSGHALDKSTTRFGQEQAVHMLLSRDDDFVRLIHANHNPPYIAMEWVPAGDLRTRQETQPLNRAEAVEAIALASQAVCKMHKLSMIHRDLSPENIYMFYEDGRMRIKIGDFGITRIGQHSKSGDHNFHTTIWGKPDYAPAEQLNGKANPKSDVFALGCVLHFLIHGNSPESIATDASRRIVKDSGDTDLDKIIKRCVEPVLDDRPDSSELAELLRGWLNKWRTAQAALKIVLDNLVGQLRPLADLQKEINSLILLSRTLGLDETNKRIQLANGIQEEVTKRIDNLFTLERTKFDKAANDAREEAATARKEAAAALETAAAALETAAASDKRAAIAHRAQRRTLVAIFALTIVAITITALLYSTRNADTGAPADASIHAPVDASIDALVHVSVGTPVDASIDASIACAEGQVLTNGHCCWAGQAFDIRKKVCDGTPTYCPDGLLATNVDCIRAWVGDWHSYVDQIVTDFTLQLQQVDLPSNECGLYKQINHYGVEGIFGSCSGKLVSCQATETKNGGLTAKIEPSSNCKFNEIKIIVDHMKQIQVTLLDKGQGLGSFFAARR